MEIGKLIVDSALTEFQKNRDLEPLLKLLETEDGVRYLAHSDEARQILADAARGLSVKGKGRAKTSEQRARDQKIAGMVALLEGMGLVVKNNPDRNRKGSPQTLSACRVAAQYYAMTEDAVYKIWNKASDEHYYEKRVKKMVGELFLADGKIPSLELIKELYGTR